MENLHAASGQGHDGSQSRNDSQYNIGRNSIAFPLSPTSIIVLTIFQFLIECGISAVLILSWQQDTLIATLSLTGTSSLLLKHSNSEYIICICRQGGGGGYNLAAQ